MATRMNRRQRGRHNLFRMLAGGVGARKKHIDRTRERTRSELMRQQQLAEAKEEKRIRESQRGAGFGRGLQTAIKVGSLASPLGWPAALAIGAGAGLMSGFAPSGADPYLQQGLAAAQAMQGHQKQMELMDRQLAAQEAHMSGILQSLQSGRSAYASAPQYPAGGFTGRSNHPYDSPMWDT